MHTLMQRSLVFSVAFLVLSCILLVESTSETSTSFHQCIPVANLSCARHFNMREGSWYARFPNARGLDLNRSIGEFSDFSWLLHQNNYCSRMLYILLCFYYFPPCSPQSGPQLIARPCNEVCREAAEACLPIAKVMRGDSLRIPRHLDCSNFESGTRVLEDIRGPGSDGPSVLLACPNATIHVDFALPPGKLVYEVLESESDLQVCLILANVGSFDPSSSLNVSVLVHLSTIQTGQSLYEQATPVVDYVPLSTILIFPLGSDRRHKLCATISITNNEEMNSNRSFSVKAAILSPSSASFGGSAQSSFGVLEAVIIDDDDIRVSFKFPSERTRYESYEDRGYVEVCLTLLSDYQVALSSAVTVTLSPTTTSSTIFVRAEPGLDYSVTSLPVVFPVGSAMGNGECANISISADGLVEADESFSITASISSLDGYQPSDTAEVIIRDDDECVIPAGQCRRSCDTRDSANKGTFKQNCYAYAAHVEAIGQRYLQGCSALDVTVLQCWELQTGACVSNGSRLTVPACQNCDTLITAGREYLIAGLHNANVGMTLPNYRKGGLIGDWVERKYSSISEWVQTGIDFKKANSVSGCNV